MTDREPASLPVATPGATWQALRTASRGRRRGLTCGALAGVLGAAAGLVAPAAVGRLVDRIATGTATLGTVLIAFAVMAVAALIGAGGVSVASMLIARGYHAILADLREGLIERAFELPQDTVERAGTGDLIARSSDDVATVADAAPRIVPALTTAAFSILVSIAGMVTLDPRFAFALVVLIPVYVVTVRWYLSTGPAIYRAERAATSRRAQAITESQRGHRTVIGLRLGNHRHELVASRSWAVVEHSLRARTVQNMFFGRLNLAEYLGLAAILATGFWLTEQRAATIGAATTAVLLFLRLFGPINQLLIVLDVVQSVLASLGRIVGLMTMQSDADDRGRSTDGGGTRVRAVDFAHQPGFPTIANIDLDIPAGRCVAVVGASGAGKTTLATVIAGVRRPTAGTVDRPGRTALVAQEVHTFTASMRDNLTLAAPDATDAEIIAALRTCGAAGLLDELADGLDTDLGPFGHQLTSAQSQLLALVRVQLADPELVILDEATAEAGSAHAELLDGAAAAVLGGRAGLLIAHRLSQAVGCDHIVVMENGRIVESGTHAQLLDAGARYTRLWRAWESGRRAVGLLNRSHR